MTCAATIIKEKDAPLADWEKSEITPSITQMSQEILSGFVLSLKISLM
jgi:hypothetical protein